MEWKTKFLVSSPFSITSSFPSVSLLNGKEALSVYALLSFLLLLFFFFLLLEGLRICKGEKQEGMLWHSTL